MLNFIFWLRFTTGNNQWKRSYKENDTASAATSDRTERLGYTSGYGGGGSSGYGGSGYGSSVNVKYLVNVKFLLFKWLIRVYLILGIFKLWS